VTEYGQNVKWELEAKLNDRLPLHRLFKLYRDRKSNKWCAKCNCYVTKYHQHYKNED